MPVKITGMGKLLAELDAFNVNIPGALAIAGKKAMSESIEGPAKRSCPVDTGRLRASIHTVAQTGPKGAVIQTGTNVFYGIYQEFGTGIYAINGEGRKTPWRYIYQGKKGPKGLRWTQGVKPTKFMLKAVEKNAPDIPEKVAESLRKQIRTACEKKNLASVSQEVA